ncbi:hypothetical protein BJ508DRAFT_322588 [Ascobolus immersus RN42]|uniref:Zn(2)-C6 fungal-type domain-containing protein n=1 Tax=Ascobolus immersus RN42 TaxID=1160509 RepID=A0A3N4ILG4_ASCIM|nr:hypothetical protein BJ508DRAFT_322588 [Ascobolus immersus RN42]
MSEPGRFAASSEERDRITRVRTLRSCVTCRNRKVRCDKQRPCGACRRSGSECIFLTEARRPPQPRLPNAVLLERIERLESVIEMISTKNGPSSSSDPSSTSLPQQLIPQPSRARELDQVANVDHSENHGRLFNTDDGSRYMGPSYWAIIKPELDNVKEALEQAITPQEETENYSNVLSFFARSLPKQLSDKYPNPNELEYIYRRYVESVDPFIRIIHKPTFERQLRLFQEHPNHPGLGANFEPLLFGMCLVSITSMHPDFIRSHHQTTKEQLLQKYRVALEEALANARYLHCKDIPTLQGMIFCVIALRHTDLIRSSLSLLAMVVTAAKGMGLHRDGGHFNLKPVELELRRRIWYTIALLDIHTHEELGLEPLITDNSYDTLPPLNINDTDLSDERPLPIERSTFTEMTHLLVFVGTMHSFRKIATLSSQKFDTSRRPGEKIEIIFNAINKEIAYSNDKWLQNIDDSVPIQWLTKTFYNMIACKARVVLYHPFLHLDSTAQTSLVSQERREVLFTIGVQALECNAAILQSRSSDPYNWYFQFFHIAHTGALVINDLAHLPPCHLVDRAWVAIDFLVSNPDPYRTGTPNWSRYIRAFQKLFEKAYIQRERTGAGGIHSQNPGLATNLNNLRMLFHSDPNTPPSAPHSTSASSSPSASNGLASEEPILPLPFMDHPFDPMENAPQQYQNVYSNWVSITTTTAEPNHPIYSCFVEDMIS